MAIKNVIIPTNLGNEFDLGVVTANKITVKAATNTLAGKVLLAIAAAYPSPINDTSAVTPAFVKAAIDAAVATLPADKFLQSASFNNSTNVLTLTLSTGANITISLSDLLPIVTSSSNSITMSGVGTVANPVTGNVKLDVLAGNLLKVTTAGAKVDSTDITALASVDVQDAFGVHLHYSFP